MFSDTLAQHLLTAGTAVALSFAMAVAVQPHNQVAHRWLALFLVCMGLLALSESLAIGAQQDAALLRWQGLLAWSVAALAPALFMYVRHLLSASPTPPWQGALHFAPALVLGLPLMLISVLHPQPEWWRAHAQLGAQTGQRTPGLISALLALQWAGYGLWAWRLLQHYRQRLLAQYSNVDQRRMGWLGALIACMPALLLLWLLARLGGSGVAAVVNTLYAPVGVLALAVLALRQPAVFLAPLDPQPISVAKDSSDSASPPGLVAAAASASASASASATETETETETATKAALATLPHQPAVADPPGASTSAEDEARWSDLQAQLGELLRTERPYLDNDLSLGSLARQLQTSTHHLSFVLNRRLGQSFYELINEQRVREVQRCLHDPAYASQSILEIALDAGFSSKASFNAAFRRHAGTTPSAYRQRGTAAQAA
jgi:AraC-like DNA-binding protein